MKQIDENVPTKKMRMAYPHDMPPHPPKIFVSIEDVDVTAVRTLLDLLVKKNLAWELLVIPRLKAQFDVTYGDAKQLWNNYIETVGQKQIA